MFCHFNTISLSTVIAGWQVIYKPIKIWVANKSSSHVLTHFYGTCFRSQAPLNTRVPSQTRVGHTRHSSLAQTARVPHPGLHPRGGQACSALCPALSLASSEQDTREVTIRRLGDEQGEEIRKTKSSSLLRAQPSRNKYRLLDFFSAISWNVLSMQWKYPVIWGIFKLSE